MDILDRSMQLKGRWVVDWVGSGVGLKSSPEALAMSAYVSPPMGPYVHMRRARWNEKSKKKTEWRQTTR
jgi:hypothetical protein